MMAKDTCCMQRRGILKLLMRRPRLLASSVETMLRPAVSTLTDLGFSRADIARKVVQNQQLLTCKPERYKEILRVMQEHGIMIKVPLSPSRVHGITRIEIFVANTDK